MSEVQTKRIGTSGQFIDHDDGTVTDTQTGLMWKRAAEGQEWRDSEVVGGGDVFDKQSEAKIRRTFAGYNDWRIPTVDELISLVRPDNGEGAPTIDVQVFPNTPRKFFATNNRSYLRIEFRFGSTRPGDPSSFSCVRLVRAGKAVQHLNLKLTVIPRSSGKILINPHETTKYLPGSTPTLTAEPALGYSFKCWRENASGESPSCALVMDADKSVTAEFELNSYSLAVQTTGTGQGTVQYESSLSYAYGTSILLTAVASVGSVFVRWIGSDTDDGSDCIVTMDSDKSVTAEFAKLVTLESHTTGSGQGAISRDPAHDLYAQDSTVTITASPQTGSKFLRWEEAAGGTNPITEIQLNATNRVAAVFALMESYPLDVATTGTGSGVVNRSINAPSYLEGTEVALTAVADEGSIFNGWHGDGNLMDDAIVVTTDAALSLQAEFLQRTIADTEITTNLISVTREEIKRGQNVTVFRLELRNDSKQSARVKVPLTSFVSRSGQTAEQSGWISGLVNGAKGVTLAPGTFCEMGLIHFARADTGDRLHVVVEYVQSPTRVNLTFQCVGKWDEFQLISAVQEELDDAPSSKTNYPTMASALKRIESLEATLADVVRRLDAIQNDWPMAGRKVNPSHSRPVQTLAEVWAWIAEHERIDVVELRARLLPLDLLPGAAVDELNERALDLTGVIALEQIGDEIVVVRTIFDEVLSKWDMDQPE
jgi:Protein of unknown function (DUF1566)/Divergent InlB B-repeat domain